MRRRRENSYRNRKVWSHSGSHWWSQETYQRSQHFILVFSWATRPHLKSMQAWIRLGKYSVLKVLKRLISSPPLAWLLWSCAFSQRSQKIRSQLWIASSSWPKQLSIGSFCKTMMCSTQLWVVWSRVSSPKIGGLPMLPLELLPISHSIGLTESCSPMQIRCSTFMRSF